METPTKDYAAAARAECLQVADLPLWRIHWLAFWKRRVERWLVAGSVLYVAVIALLILWDGVNTARLPPQIKVAAKTSHWNRHTIVFDLIGRDKAGRRAAFQMMVLKRSFRWAQSGGDDLMFGGVRMSSEIARRAIFDEELRNTLARARQIIAVGWAGQFDDAQRELARAERRATKTAEWLSAVVPASMPLWTLNLGQYSEPCEQCESEEMSWRNPFAVILLSQEERGVDISEALAAALSGKSNIPSPARFSNFEMQHVR